MISPCSVSLIVLLPVLAGGRVERVSERTQIEGLHGNPQGVTNRHATSTGKEHRLKAQRVRADVRVPGADTAVGTGKAVGTNPPKTQAHLAAQLERVVGGKAVGTNPPKTQGAKWSPGDPVGVARRHAAASDLLWFGEKQNGRLPAGVLGRESIRGQDVVFYYGARHHIEAVSWAPIAEKHDSWTVRYATDLRSRLSTFSKREVAGFSVVLHNDGTATLVFADRSLHLSAQDCKKIVQGKQPANPEFAGLFRDQDVTYVFVANVFSEDYASPTGRLADAVVQQALDAHPSARLVRDPMDAETHHRIESVTQFDKGRALQVRAIIPDKQHGVVDGKLLQNIRDDLVEHGVKVDTSPAVAVDTPKPAVAVDTSPAVVVETPPTVRLQAAKTEAPAPLQAVIVISGHSSHELANFVDSIGPVAIRDAIVIFESCGTRLTRELVRKMIRAHGAAAVFAFSGTITVDQLEPATIDLAKEFQPSPDRPASGRLLRIRKILRTHRLRAVPFVEDAQGAPVQTARA
jgi:hypothetical protein